MSVKKKQSNSIERITEMSDSIQHLSNADRAMIYAIIWCSSDKSNLEHYPLDNLMEVADRIRRFINHC